MTMTRFRQCVAISGLVLMGTLAGCTGSPEVARHLIEPPAPAERLRDRLGQVELREVGLPEYASGQEVSVQSADGTLYSGPGNIWADDPARGITATLASQLVALTGATVIAEPWPLQDQPQRRLEVRMERIVAQNDGTFRMSGQYFLVPVTATGRDIVRSFDISVPMASQEFSAIAAANARAIDLLARRIAALE
jgi:uncharacterized lipoprotein YmbA